jgi:hypothetical protein
MAADNAFKRLKLDPWNAVPRLELAGVYAGFLGRVDEANLLRDLATDFAAKNGVEYAIPGIDSNLKKAVDLGRQRNERSRRPGGA